VVPGSRFRVHGSGFRWFTVLALAARTLNLKLGTTRTSNVELRTTGTGNLEPGTRNVSAHKFIQRDCRCRGDVQRVHAIAHRDANEKVTRVHRRARESFAFVTCDERHAAIPERIDRFRDRRRPFCRREADDQRVVVLQQTQRVGPRLDAREWNRQRGSHRRANRFPVERIGGRSVEQHGIHAERRSVPEDGAHVVGVADSLEDHQTPRTARERPPVAGDRPFADRQAPAVNVEPGDCLHERRRHEIDGNIRPRVEYVLHRDACRIGEHHGARLHPRPREQPPHDEPTLGNEDPSPLDQLRIGNVTIVVEARIARIVDGLDHA